MEEIVRAFNFVIDQGWVSALNANMRCIYLCTDMLDRHFIGGRQSGLLVKSKRHIVSSFFYL